MANSVVILTKLVPVVLMYLVVSAPYAEGAVSCGSVASKIAPCINYLTKGGALPVPCCDGVKALNAAAQTTPDRQASCGCLKSIASRVTGLNLGLISSLAAKCGVSIPYKFSPSIDCATVK